MNRESLILKLDHVSKSFPGVKALDEVSIEVRRGSIHGLIGENGAGKSTMMKILSGVYQRDGGEVWFDGRRLDAITPALSRSAGISIIYQEFNLVPALSIAENIFLGRLGEREDGGRGRTVPWRRVNRRAAALLEDIGCAMDVTRLVQELSVAQMQMVEIAKSLSYEAELLIMDEPTAPLTSNELETFFAMVRRLRERGVTIIFISHKLDEIFSLCDAVTVMRDGRIIDTRPIGETDKDEVIRKMIGREMDQEFPARAPCVRDEVLLDVRDLRVRGRIDGIDFRLHRGEILGIVGLVGTGRTEIARTVFGAQKHASARVEIEGSPARIRSPHDAIRSRVMLLPEDRKQEGLFLEYSIERNIPAAGLDRVRRGIFLSRAREEETGKQYIDKLRIKTPGGKQLVLGLSGGNQQKVVAAKALFADPQVLIMDEPTRGVDVGAKYDIYAIMNEMVREGKGILFISSELNELFGMCDRLIVVYDKKITGEFPRECFGDTQAIMKCMLGQTGSKEATGGGRDACES